MLFLTSFVGLLCLGAAAPLTPRPPYDVENSIQVRHVLFSKWIPQISEQISPRLERYTKRSESSTDSGESVDEPGILPKRSESSTDSGESVDVPGDIPKRSESSTDSGESVDEPGVLPK